MSKEITSHTILCPLCKSTDVHKAGYPNPDAFICNRCALNFRKDDDSPCDWCIIFLPGGGYRVSHLGSQWSTMSDWEMARAMGKE